MSLGPSEIVVVIVVALVVLGPDKLPDAARNCAKFYRQFREFSNSVRAQVEDALDVDDHKNDERPVAQTAQQPPDFSQFKLVDQPSSGSGTPSAPEGDNDQADDRR